jgi:hypothetical protein
VTLIPYEKIDNSEKELNAKLKSTTHFQEVGIVPFLSRFGLVWHRSFPESANKGPRLLCYYCFIKKHRISC